MTEVMVQSHLEGGFSFSGSKFNHIQTANEAEMSESQNNRPENSCINQINIDCDKNSEDAPRKVDTSDVGESNAQATMLSESERTKNSEPESMQIENTIPSEDYKIVETKTTVINETYNLITHSTTRKVMSTSGETSSWSSFPRVMSEAVDKSRVIVQVLKSDTKSKEQNVTETKPTCGENQSTHSFRDDLCKLLSPHSSKFGDRKKNKLFPVNSSSRVSDVSENVPSGTQNTKPNIVRARRKFKLNRYFLNGHGMKVRDLKCVSDNMRQATPASLRYLHYIMFNSFGLCGTGLQLLKTKKNIGNFCGYPFKKSSEQFQKKINCLNKIPEPMLIGIYRAVFGKNEILSRLDMVERLLDFLLMPRRCSDVLKKYEKERKLKISEEEYAALKEMALKGPSLTVMLKKLSENLIPSYASDNAPPEDRITECESANKDETEEIEKGSSPTIAESSPTMVESSPTIAESSPTIAEPSPTIPESSPTIPESSPTIPESSLTIPAFILNGPGTKLKYFPKIAHNVKMVHEKPIKMLHYILYGRIEPSITDCRRNILEFNGFSECQQEFAAERKDIIKGLNQRELFELCQILCLRGKTNSREVRIKKILEYLQSPTKPIIHKPVGAARWQKPISSRGRLETSLSKRSYKGVYKRRKTAMFNVSKSGFEAPQPITASQLSYTNCSNEVFNEDDWKLRDFKTICSNIECAAPSDLIELNDVLFLKTCDEVDIHQKILDFRGFKFPVDSFHYDARKTLMHYMGFCVLRKIALLLDIDNWDKITNHDDLASNILKFLMERKESSVFAKPMLPSPKSYAESNCAQEPSSTPSPSSKTLYDESCSVKPSSSNSQLESCYPTKPSSPSSSKSSLEGCCVVEPPPSTSPKSFFESSYDLQSSPSSSMLEDYYCVENPETPKSLKSEVFQQTNQAVTHHKSKVIIQRLTKASVETQEMCQSGVSDDKTIRMHLEERFKPSLPYIDCGEDDSVRLRDLIHHPTEQELKDLICELVKENLWCFTLGDLVQKVYECYPNVNLAYRESFIKATARQMLSELRDYAVSAVKDYSF